MPMKSNEAIAVELKAKISNALNSEKPEELANVFAEFAKEMSESIIADARTYQETKDSAILAARGIRQLTTEEKGFYQKFLDGIKTKKPEESFAVDGGAWPSTIVNDVENGIRNKFELLDAIDFEMSTVTTKFIINQQGAQLAVFGAFGSIISNELSGSIGLLDISNVKLFAWIPVSEDFVEAGVEWLDAYVRAILVEAMGSAMCLKAVDGTGKNEPIGMSRDFSATANVVNGVYPQKIKVVVSDLGLNTLSAIFSELATDDTGRTRIVDDVILVVNPVDYYRKIVPEFTVRDLNGNYVFKPAYPIKVIAEPGVTANSALIGIGKRYKMRASLGDKTGIITYDDSAMFAEDLRAYKAKALCNGRPYGINDFLFLDITAVQAGESDDDDDNNSGGGESGGGSGENNPGGGESGGGSGENNPGGGESGGGGENGGVGA